ncbi:MAG: thermonuclease family protein [Alphaproteobacteria bacterium]|nr:thermonuclease family protein [Alphaproteobacteria bacterium]
MKILAALFILTILSLPAFAAARIPPLNADATVDRIIDGDTFVATLTLENGARVGVRVRFMEIDAPELSGDCERERQMAQASKVRLGEIVPIGSTVTLTEIKDDKYQGRINAYVFVGDLDVGAKMIAENHAIPYGGGRRSPWCTDQEIAAEQKRVLLSIHNANTIK